MKKFDLVRLINERKYLNNGLKKDMRGIVVTEGLSFVEVLFFNPDNVGDFAIVPIDKNDIVMENEKLPLSAGEDLKSVLEKANLKPKSVLKPLEIKEYDFVELVVEKEEYAKYGIHKGEKGCVTEAKAVKNYVEVDFSGVDENGEYYGDCIAVKVNDLKVIE